MSSVSVLRRAILGARVSSERRTCRAIASRTHSFASIAGQDEARWEYDHDVLVVGGGIVGSSLVCRLAEDAGGGRSSTLSGGDHAGDPAKKSARPSVALIETRPPQPLEAVLSREGHDPRVYALTPSSAGFLKRLGVWDSSGKGDADADADAGGARMNLGVVKERAQPFGSMQVWDDRGPGHVRFTGKARKSKRVDPLGFISEHGVIHSSLFERVRELESLGLVELTCPAEVKRVAFPAKGAGGAVGPMTVTVETRDGETRDMTCRLLVAADGGSSKVARMLGMASWGWGYGQRAVVATVRLASSHEDTAFQRYLSRGPLAVLPLGNDHASLVWSTTPEHAEQLKALSPDEFLAEVNDALRLPSGTGVPPKRSAERSAENQSRFPVSGAPASAGAAGWERFLPPGFDRVLPELPGLPLKGLPAAVNPLALADKMVGGVLRGMEGVSGAFAGLSSGVVSSADMRFSVPPEAVELVTPRLGFDLSLRQAHRYTGDRAALVGDAAHTIHPMAGQGLNLGLADAEALAQAVLEGRRSGTDAGSSTLLARYEEERKMDALVMMGALDSLHRLFGAEGRAIAAVRNAGLSAFNLAGPIKERVMQHAMGGRGLRG